MLANDKGWVKNTAMKTWLSPHLTLGGVLSKKSVAEQATIVKSYLSAIKDTWPDQWGDNKTYSLTSAMGFEIMFSVFQQVKQRIDLNNGREYAPKNFVSQMAPLKTAKIKLPGDIELPFDWTKKGIGGLNNAKTRALITKQLRDVLHEADEDTIG